MAMELAANPAESDRPRNPRRFGELVEGIVGRDFMAKNPLRRKVEIQHCWSEVVYTIDSGGGHDSMHECAYMPQLYWNCDQYHCIA
ncbi:hypothetical protein RRSWK_06261 [Rhodopirellula sp. SWK7]|nr:hypothetical protein RRSWK_06261 [Rhodopirellula sp. SWK7]